jgi:hypothetical protein
MSFARIVEGFQPSLDQHNPVTGRLLLKPAARKLDNLLGSVWKTMAVADILQARNS